MGTVKRLWAVCISVGIVILSAFPSALAVNTGEGYLSLEKPVYALKDGWYTYAWAVVYLCDIAALTSLISKGAQGARLNFPLASGVFNVFWCYVFFRLKRVSGAAVVLGITVLYTLFCAILNVKKNKTVFALYLAKTLWLSYLFAVIVAVKV